MLLFQARPDGYTLAHHHLSVIRHPFLTKQPTWDPMADFTYIMQQTGFVFGPAVHPARLQDARRHVGRAASGGPGS